MDEFIAGRVGIRDVRKFTCTAIHDNNANTSAAEACLKELDRAICRRNGRRVEPDALIFNALIKVYRNARDLAGAEGCMERMRALNIDPTTSTYNSLISAFGNANDLDRAQAWFDRLIADPKLAPDSLSFASMIWSCGMAELPRSGRLGERWFALMLTHGVAPDAGVYCALMFAHGRSDDLGAAAECLDRMRDEHGIAPDVACYNTMIKLCMHLGKLKEADGWLGRMQRRGLSPDRQTWRALGRAPVPPFTSPARRP